MHQPPNNCIYWLGISRNLEFKLLQHINLQNQVCWIVKYHFWAFFPQKGGISCPFNPCCFLFVTSTGLLWERFSSKSAGSLLFAFLLPWGSQQSFPPWELWQSLLPPSFHQAKSGFQEFPNHVNNMNPIQECISIRRQPCLRSNQRISLNPVCSELPKISFHCQNKIFRSQKFGLLSPFSLWQENNSSDHCPTDLPSSS